MDICMSIDKREMQGIAQQSDSAVRRNEVLTHPTPWVNEEKHQTKWPETKEHILHQFYSYT